MSIPPVPKLTIVVAMPTNPTDTELAGTLLDENGTEFWSHVSSSTVWLLNDLLGRADKARNDTLTERYPSGYGLIFRLGDQEASDSDELQALYDRTRLMLPPHDYARAMHERFDNQVESIVDDLRAAIDQIQRQIAKPLRAADDGRPDFAERAQSIQNVILWKVANMHLDFLTGAASDADRAYRKQY